MVAKKEKQLLEHKCFRNRSLTCQQDPQRVFLLRCLLRGTLSFLFPLYLEKELKEKTNLNCKSEEIWTGKGRQSVQWELRKEEKITTFKQSGTSEK